MKIQELNARRASIGERPVNTSAEFAQYGINLWRREDGLWVIATDSGRGKPAYQHATSTDIRSGRHADAQGILTFDSEDAACDYLWDIDTAAPQSPATSRFTSDSELATYNAKMEERFDQALRAHQDREAKGGDDT